MRRGVAARPARRRRLVLPGLVLAIVAGCGGEDAVKPGSKRMIVLGFDGMDHELTRRLMAEGRMPSFSRLAASGVFGPLGTSVPPQSPVAWSNFITGMDSGGHGIFDFVHRDPKTMIPYLSTSRTSGSTRSLKVGKWKVPLASGSVELLRRGVPFWQALEERGYHASVLRMPANFPPSGQASEELSGMGTPDLLGTYGTFSFYTSDPTRFAGKDIGGGKVHAVQLDAQGTVSAHLLGPENPYRVQREKARSEFFVYVDRETRAAKLVAGAEERVLAVGEWTDWVPVEFPLAPTQSLRGMCRFYLRSVEPVFELYATPVNIDPVHPALPISTPDSYAAELAFASGRFYTQGMPEDTKARTDGIFSAEEFLAQAKLAGDEVIAQYERVLGRFREGLLFYYFGNLDQVSHIAWRTLDPAHPAYDAAKDGPLADVIPDLYRRFDGIVGHTLAHMPEDTTLVVMSDHGFTSWRRAFHLNSWLRDRGYVKLRDPGRKDDPGLFANVDWPRTRAYAIGINGLYLNLRGRERWGMVEPGDRERLLGEIERELLATIDPATGGPAVTRVYRTETYFRDRGELALAPDIIVGYAKGTRGSNESALGKFPAEAISDNHDEWSGDHCMDHEAVPGILLTSRALARPADQLQDLGAAILAEFAIEGFPPAAVTAAGVGGGGH